MAIYKPKEHLRTSSANTGKATRPAAHSVLGFENPIATTHLGLCTGKKPAVKTLKSVLEYFPFSGMGVSAIIPAISTPEKSTENSLAAALIASFISDATSLADDSDTTCTEVSPLKSVSQPLVDTVFSTRCGATVFPSLASAA